MMSRVQHRAGFSLMELLIVITIVGILAALLVPNANTSISEQLESAAGVLAADLDYARSLALAYNGTYRMTFDATAKTWTLMYSGTDTTLSVLPASPYHSPLDPSDRQTTRLASLPGLSIPVSIYTMYVQASPLQAASDVEFGPLGSTSRVQETVVWLSAGAGAATRYVEVRVNPVTGLATVGNFQTSAPATPGGAGQSNGATQVGAGGT